MDPNNTNSNVNPAVTPTTSAMPEIPTAPEAPAPVIPVASAMPEIPTAPVAPVAPVMPEMAMPEMPAAPAAPVMNAAETPAEPVAAPVVEPVAPAAPVMPEAPAAEAPVEPVAPVAPAAPVMPEIPTPVSPIFQPGDTMVGATDPITMPNPPKEPDPIEEELNAPMKAASPVPGSIGSAISMPSEQVSETQPVTQTPNQIGQVPSVAFNDPAAAAATAAMAAAPVAKKKTAISDLLKTKLDKKTLIMLCVLAGVVVLALAVVLVTQMM